MVCKMCRKHLKDTRHFYRKFLDGHSPEFSIFVKYYSTLLNYTDGFHIGMNRKNFQVPLNRFEYNVHQFVLKL